jgi:hypothetical protein
MDACVLVQGLSVTGRPLRHRMMRGQAESLVCCLTAQFGDVLEADCHPQEYRHARADVSGQE